MHIVSSTAHCNNSSIKYVINKILVGASCYMCTDIIVTTLKFVVGNSTGQMFTAKSRAIEYFLFPFKIRAPLINFSSCHFVLQSNEVKTKLTFVPILNLINLAEVRQGS